MKCNGIFDKVKKYVYNEYFMNAQATSFTEN